MIVARPFDIQWQFSRHKRLPRKSKVGEGVVDILSRQRRRTKQEKERERDERKRRIEYEVLHRKPNSPCPPLSLSLFFSLFLLSHSVPLPFGRSCYLYLPSNSFSPSSFIPLSHPFPAPLSRVELPPSRCPPSLSPLFTASSYRCRARDSRITRAM